MKIGIVTLPLNNNYGGVLQNYALQCVLRKMGHSPITIFYKYSLPFPRNIIHQIKVFFSKKKASALYTTEDFSRFISNNIDTTEPIKKYKKDIVEAYDIECLIVGSDQVWRPRYSQFCFYDMFLRFAYKTDLLKIAYAASFGTDKWELSNKQTNKCKKLIQQFSAISVREESAVSMCEKLLNVTASHVVDPTFLLSRTDYERIMDKELVVSSNQLLIYVLDMNDELKSNIEEYANQNSLLPIYLTSDSFDKTKTISIEMWLAYICKSKMIITDSFHGTVFSIIFHKDFRTIVNNKRGVDRFLSLLSKLELTNHIINPYKPIIRSMETDWYEVEKKLNNWIDYSLNFINSNIRL